MRIQTQDGLVLSGTAEEIVEYLRTHSQTPSQSPTEFMAQTASRVLLWNKVKVDTRSVSAFLRSLAVAGLVEIQQDCEQLGLGFA